MPGTPRGRIYGFVSNALRINKQNHSASNTNVCVCTGVRVCGPLPGILPECPQSRARMCVSWPHVFYTFSSLFDASIADCVHCAWCAVRHFIINQPPKNTTASQASIYSNYTQTVIRNFARIVLRSLKISLHQQQEHLKLLKWWL